MHATDSAVRREITVNATPERAFFVFTEPKVAEAVEVKRDVSHGMIRTEVVCKRCGGHLGHVFEDGPRDRGGLRYCMNSCAMDFQPAATE